MSWALLCDIGNTAIKVRLLKKGADRASISLPTAAQTPDSLGAVMRQALQAEINESEDFSICMAASVVPDLDWVLKLAVRKYFACETLFLGKDFETPLENSYEKPAAVGADRLAAAYGARVALPDAGSIIVVDFGTAITFDCVTGNSYGGGFIFPGAKAAMAGLYACIPRLPYIRFNAERIESGPGRSTESCLRSGLVFGYASLTQGLCKHLASTLPEPVAYVAGGGEAQTITKLCPFFDRLMPDLVLDGLLALYRKFGYGFA